MKKLLFFLSVGLLLSAHVKSQQSMSKSCAKEYVCCFDDFQDARFNLAFSSGYVFKHSDHNFREVYGLGMGNIFTADFCYKLCDSPWGFGAKASYWLAFGKTTFLQRHTWLQEVPVIAYVRLSKDFDRGVRLYGSLGGGFAYIREKSYLGHVQQVRGLGEVEAGFMYPVHHHLSIFSAFRYLFPRQKHDSIKIDVGGFDVRAGLTVYF
jgi:opacity protein-like surface antigen